MLEMLSSTRVGESALQIAKSAYIRSAVLLIYSTQDQHAYHQKRDMDALGRTDNSSCGIAACEG